MFQYDCIIVGSGIAALATAAEICEKMSVLVITKGSIRDSNSSLAQGGVAATISKRDHWKAHFEDTCYAGRFHNLPEAVELLVQQGKLDIEQLIQNGMTFDKDANGHIHLGMEGAHQQPRILHAGGDATGRKLIQFFIERVNKNVTIMEHTMVTDIHVVDNRALGVWISGENQQERYISGKHIVLATGGCGAIFDVTSNSPFVTGDGLAMAYRAGASLVDLEFTQFHPTLLYIEGTCKGLVSEAVRGEGAVLVDDEGRRIMKGVHPLEDLAPRDVVARTIQKVRADGREVYLDISMISQFSERFPTITKLVSNAGLSLDRKKIPVAPGMHFLMGGIRTDLFGRTSVERLYAVGEVACTGVHGANRLASNSLLEGLVFAKQLANVLRQPTRDSNEKFKENNTYVMKTLHLPKKMEIQQIMSRYVGIERDETGLRKALHFFEQYVNQTSFFQCNVKRFTKEEVELLNMVTVGWLITKAALKRTESRGGHFRTDYPNEVSHWLQKRIPSSLKQQLEVS